MNSRKRKEEMLRALCANWHPDDGVDPREDKRRDDNNLEKPDRKLHQLCRQAQRALQLALDALPHAAALGLTLRDVVPAPNAGRLCVLVSVPTPALRAEAIALLNQRAGWLRTDVAAAVSRRRAPELTFQIVIAECDHE